MVWKTSWLRSCRRRPSWFRFKLSTGSVQASGTITLSSMVATDTITINGVVFTCEASGATGNQFNVGGTDTITATNAAKAINASVTAKVLNYVTASSSGAVITITAVQPGLQGNMNTIAVSAHGSGFRFRLLDQWKRRQPGFNKLRRSFLTLSSTPLHSA